MKTTRSWALLSCTAALLAACSSTPPATPKATTAASAAAMAPVATAPNSAASQKMAESAVTTVNLPAYLDPNNPVSKERSVYFDFDDAKLKSEYNSLVELQGNFLRSHPNVSIKIEGNCDERGSARYNLALGQKRAETVLHALNTAGVATGQMEAISWGSERPKALGHDEAAWAQNRRADIVYPNK
ncbi:MAG: peptidoglycan-associated lipoprotein Pal [Burkholderiales bacterium]|nr:peptidoglycan-associated lipoprotein Pal [Burkholderiales bacterium]MDE2457511.1 peptidoglycan-associated lipoprotein Pal [Burkholderiales bacterium]